MNKQNLLETVLNGAWGTIGPKSISSAELLAQKVNGKYGLLLHSASAALECQLRSLEIAYGDEVITASYGDPINSMAVAAVGATPVFADIDSCTGALSPESVKKALSDKTKAVVADIPGGNPCDVKKLAEICKNSEAKLIINLGDGYNSLFNGQPLTKYAWGTIINLSDGYALSAGEGGALIHNDETAHHTCFAYHNCGRAMGEGAGLIMNDILGSNMRITEWQAAMIEAGLSELDKILTERKNKARSVLENLKYDWLTAMPVVDNGVSSFSSVIYKYNKEKNNNLSVNEAVNELRNLGYDAAQPWRAMHRQPVFTSPYFQKITGYTSGYGDDGLENSIAAEKELIWIK